MLKKAKAPKVEKEPEKPKPEEPEYIQTAREWFDGEVNPRLNSGISSWLVISKGAKGAIHKWQQLGNACHYDFYTPGRYITGEPVVHAEAYCRGRGNVSLGDAGKRYFKWLDGPDSLFGPWNKDVEQIVNANGEIQGALWKDMTVHGHIVSQWFFAGRMPGEHNRHLTWDALTQAGMPPLFAFWAAHFYGENNGVYSYAPIGHIGVTTESTLPRILARKPILEEGDYAYFHKPHHMAVSNKIWDSSRARDVYSPLFPKRKMESKTFGALKISGIDVQGFKDGLNKLQDEGKLEIKNEA